MKIRVIAYRMPGWQKSDMMFYDVEETAAGVRELRRVLEGGGMMRIEHMIDMERGFYLFTEAEVESAGWNTFCEYKGDIWCYSVKDFSYKFERVMK